MHVFLVYSALAVLDFMIGPNQQANIFYAIQYIIKYISTCAKRRETFADMNTAVIHDI